MARLVCRNCPVNTGFMIPVKEGCVVKKQGEENDDGKQSELDHGSSIC